MLLSQTAGMEQLMEGTDGLQLSQAVLQPGIATSPLLQHTFLHLHIFTASGGGQL